MTNYLNRLADFMRVGFDKTVLLILTYFKLIIPLNDGDGEQIRKQ